MNNKKTILLGLLDYTLIGILLFLLSSCEPVDDTQWGITIPAPPPAPPRKTENTFFYRVYDSIMPTSAVDKKHIDISVKVAPETTNLDSMCQLVLKKPDGTMHPIGAFGKDATLSIFIKFYTWSYQGKIYKIESGDTLKFFDFRTYAKHPNIFTEPPNHWEVLKL